MSDAEDEATGKDRVLNSSRRWHCWEDLYRHAVFAESLRQELPANHGIRFLSQENNTTR